MTGPSVAARSSATSTNLLGIMSAEDRAGDTFTNSITQHRWHPSRLVLLMLHATQTDTSSHGDISLPGYTQVAEVLC